MQALKLRRLASIYAVDLCGILKGLTQRCASASFKIANVLIKEGCIIKQYHSNQESSSRSGG